MTEDEKKIIDIVKMYKSGKTLSEIAQKYNTQQSWISALLRALRNQGVDIPVKRPKKNSWQYDLSVVKKAL